MSIWLCHCDDRARAFCEELRIGLIQCGVVVRELDPISPGDIGVLVSSGEGVLEFLNALPRIGDLKIIAVLFDEGSFNLDEIRGWMNLGVVDVIFEQSAKRASTAIQARLERRRRVETVIASPLVQKNLIGESPKWREALTSLIEAALFLDKFILITGESGTGKELAARLIHTLDPKMKERDMVIVDCTTIVPSLSGSELFGHTEDAFTGATRAKKGAFELADGSTLFLDEIGELPLDLQAGLLRVIQEKSFKRVGSNAWQKTQFRLVAATNRDLEAEVRGGRFRRDLYHRISAWHCRMPSLRERREDILPLAEHFLKINAPPDGPRSFDRLIKEVLSARAYLGNVRELQNLVIRLVGRHVGDGPISIGDLPHEDWPQIGTMRKAGDRKLMAEALEILLDEGKGMQEITEMTSDLLKHLAAKRADGNLARAAKLLDVHPRTLQQWRKQRREQVMK